MPTTLAQRRRKRLRVRSVNRQGYFSSDNVCVCRPQSWGGGRPPHARALSHRGGVKCWGSTTSFPTRDGIGIDCSTSGCDAPA
jgi:hypothetical protein